MGVDIVAADQAVPEVLVLVELAERIVAAFVAALEVHKEDYKQADLADG